MAACTVLAGHLGPITSAPSLGVVLFFILSGFLIGRLYLSREPSLQALVEYAVARVGRVYPLFALVVLIAAAISIFFPDSPAIPFDFSPDQIASHLLLAGDAPTIWTISVEFQFYGLFVVLWYVLPRSHARVWVLAAMVVLFAACAVYLGADGSRINLLRYLHLFTAGLLISALLKDGPSQAFQRGAGIALPVLLVGYLVAFVAIPRFYDHDQVYADLFACALCAALIVAAVCAPGSWCGKVLSWPIAVWLGEISFGTYLIHRIVQWALLESVGELPLTVNFVIASAITLLLATLVFRFYEDPMRRLVRRLAERATDKSASHQT